MSLHNKFIIVGVTGGIAAYKAAYLVRALKKQGADVQVIMTEAAKSFITELTMQALSGHPVLSETLKPQSNSGIEHIEMATKADAIIIAPATANTLARIRAGMANDLLTAIVLAATCPVYVAPAMNENMWKNPITQDNLKVLQSYGFKVISPETGFQACGASGPGRMAEPEHIVDHLVKQLNYKPLAGKKIVITAGPTKEAIDPVRFISNHSSGKMGYAIADAASNLGAEVVLISGPVSIPAPASVELVNVISAEDMLSATEKHIPHCDIFISCAAVADFRCKYISEQKIKKTSDTDSMTIELIKNPDILSTVGHHSNRPALVVGFAAETQNIEENALKKLKSKNADIIIANNVSDKSVGFNSDNNSITIYSTSHQPADYINTPKNELGYVIMNHCLRQFGDNM
ncbi:MAG: bifunctional phosphopantothenoylcysteine decarboxylase/phosphopantothenate--cysteine ligase CoaBC [Ruminobacter sp.]|uniref:bifunctional phosphopantothenoylcysteine decarboxylase/phosphopantothenate--cysteine ligase CoaBC n=1 Tax=Ruminobacter sp. TaxID=2774296 RepID=UPI001B454290|nr:bifunctional phosphopantothenoylcysteine decarboxylase/phosphopantothenate--cysteine ligase CoaBC [Ruminobacter sp.]MBP3749102.1 bifunctional phosphopantothenoylcysteine decarboxylase/phosphopantothenate--cysteine ligase CoaBC [Ruminobacter sp.]